MLLHFEFFPGIYLSLYSLQYYYKSVKEIINYVRNPIQFQGGRKIFYIYTSKKNLIIILCLKSISRYWLYLPILILLADTTKIGRYHRYRYITSRNQTICFMLTCFFCFFIMTFKLRNTKLQLIIFQSLSTKH